MHIIFIGGLADNTIGIVKSYQKEFDEIYPQHTSEYFQWHEKKKIRERLKNIKEKVGVIGHSYGGATATQVLKDIEVDLVITIDPVCRVWSKKIPKAKKWININAIPLKYDVSDYIAFVGGKWGKGMIHRADEHYNVKSNHGKFWRMMEEILSKEF